MAENETDLTAPGAGVRQAIEDAGGAGEPPVEVAEQLPLLAAHQVDQLPADPAARRAAIKEAGRKGPGRPKGSRNKSTAAWRDYILARYQSPLVALAETYSRPVADLAAELQCKPLEAFTIQIKSAAELAPYLHGKQPVEVQVSGQLPVLHLVAPADAVRLYQQQEADAAGDGGLADLSGLTPMETEEYQWVDGAAPGEVERPQSNGSGEGVDNADVLQPDPLIADQADDGEDGR